MRQSRRPVDLARVQAVEFLDSALGADRRQLIRQYVENYDTSPKLAERIWQAIYDLSQGFIYAYQTALEEALRQSNNARWKPLTPLLFARLVHYYGTDAKLRVFRFERWIPAKWMELHRTYLRASELGIERDAAVLGERRPQCARSGRSSRNTCSCCCSTSSTPATCRRRNSTGPWRSFVRGAGVCNWTPCRVRRRASSSISRARPGWDAAPATTPDRCCGISTPRRSPNRSSARSPRCVRPRRPTRVRPGRSTSCGSRSWKKSVRRFRPISTRNCGATRALRARLPPRCASDCRASARS